MSAIFIRVGVAMADRSQSDSSSRSTSFSGLLIDGVTPTGTVLGRGSYGQVLEVDWHGTICAAKNVHDIFLEGVSAAESRRVISDFERECQTWSQLRHPNVVQLLGVYFKKGSSAPILVLEKMDTTLSGYLERHSKEAFPILHKVSVLRQVAQALSYLHSQNPPLVHHDLSTNNILLCEWSFQARITDFGMTRPISVAALTRRSSIKGTLTFMAPEALREPPRYDAKLDVFSYGNVIIAILTHQWPTPDLATRYEGEQLVALNEFQRREHHIISLSKDEKTHFLAIIQSSLDNRPHRRPASSELVAAVKHIEADLVQQVPRSRSSWPAMCAELRAEKDLLATERNTLTTEKHKLEETVADLNVRATTLDTEKTKLEETVADLNARVATLDTEKHKLEEAVADLNVRAATLDTEKTKLEETVANLNVIGADLKKSVQQLKENNAVLKMQNAQFQQDFAAVQLEKQELQRQLISSQGSVQSKTKQVQVIPMVKAGSGKKLSRPKSSGRVKSAASTDVPQINDREIQEVLPMVEDLSVQAQLHGSASTSGEGGKQGEETFPSVQAQSDEVGPLVNAKLQEGRMWYLVDVRWMKQWKKFVGFDTWDRSQVGEDSANPGPIDNKSLLAGAQDDTLKDHLMEDLDYSLVPEGGWNKLLIWYGLAEGSRPIARKVIEWGMYVKHLKVEVYPIRLDLGLHPLTEGSTVTKTFSRVDKIYVVKKAIFYAFQISEGKECCLWHRYMTNSYEQVEDDDMLQESGVYTGQVMILEVKNDDGTWPRETK